MKALSKHKLFPPDLAEDIYKVKTERDHLAHHFFRDHALNFMTIAGCQLMIEQLEERHERFESIDRRVSTLQAQILEKMGFNPTQFESAAEKIEAEMLEEARARYASNFPNIRNF
jgi:hypothetical protein